MFPESPKESRRENNNRGYGVGVGFVCLRIGVAVLEGVSEFRAALERRGRTRPVDRTL